MGGNIQPKQKKRKKREKKREDRKKRNKTKKKGLIGESGINCPDLTLKII